MNSTTSARIVGILLFLAVFSVDLAFAQETENWTRFRGPNGQGISASTELPVKWSTEENIAWKTEIPGLGWSSPIFWNDKIFVTTATDGGKECRVIALDRKTGKILWNKMVFTQETRFKHSKNSYATPTPVTDGKRVYAVFGGGGFVALDFDGNVVWTNEELQYYSQHGMGASPILYEDLLVMPICPSNPEEPKRLGWQIPWDKSYLLALDKNTGKERWKGERGMTRIAHITPLILNVDGKDRIVSPVGEAIQGFDPKDGKLLWTIAAQGEGVVPSPAVGEGLLFTAWSPENKTIRTVRYNGSGDCTEKDIVWEQKKNSPGIASLLYVKPCVYTATDNGSFSAYDAKTGEFLWQKRLGGSLNPSPVFADGRFYVLSEQGKTAVLKPAADPKEEPEIVSENDLEEHTLASMVVVGKQLLIRTEKNLWMIEK